MEPMALGSPVGSPAGSGANASIYLPPFLMGDQQAPATPRSNTLSPNKAGRNVSFSFAQSPTPTSPPDFNRSQIGQKTLFGIHQDSPSTPLSGRNLVGTPTHNPGISGPPTQGLFDSLRNETNNVQSPILRNIQQGSAGTPTANFNNSAFPGNLNQSYQQGQVNDSYYGSNNNSFNTSSRNVMQNHMNNSNVFDYNQQNANIRESDFWITVFGFPPSAMTSILQHFSQCGTILDKVFPSQKGNWVHLKYSSRLECDKALNYNEKILTNNIMIGVTHCKDTSVLEKENVLDNSHNAGMNAANRTKVRSLLQHTPENSVNPSPHAPHKVSGLMNKAMDLFFSW